MKRAHLVPEEALSRTPGDCLPWPGRSVSLDGTQLHVRDTPARNPDAEPAVFVHGLGGSSQNWTDLADLLADRLDGQAIDLPGFGRSDPARSYSVAAQAARVARWIEHSDRGPVHLFGNSMGGAVAVRLAAHRPELVRTLTLISPAMPFLDPRRSMHGQFVPLLWLPGVDRLAARQFAALSPAVLAHSMIETCFGEPSRFSTQRLQEAVEEARLRYAAPWYARAYVRSLRGLVHAFVRAYLPGSGSLWRTAARITVPTLVIGGERDRLIDPRVSAQVAKVVPDSRLLMLERVGHLAQMEVPDIVARSVLALLDEVGAGTGTTLAGVGAAATHSGVAVAHGGVAAVPATGQPDLIAVRSARTFGGTGRGRVTGRTTGRAAGRTAPASSG